MNYLELEQTVITQQQHLDEQQQRIIALEMKLDIMYQLIVAYHGVEQ